ncbi:hypothetical protein M3N64_05215 [Sporolactobacillus sp. CPB3-1]|uniref:LXG domain-containing protein n=1 Tax=Sporolactobacillus mangiferae TaxID=2940498 RepID=A0ABT0M900_9BACL|nr:hypothetical protein [Sporolactobacillus mangiferae]MCL1631350.1 hypothetical protein [Sporolactobacillus mangiferae]
MSRQTDEAAYALINAAGTIIAAIGATPQIMLSTAAKNGLSIVGNALQAAGNALDAEISEGMDAFGGTTQALGNSLVIYGSLINGNVPNSLRPIIIGNSLQALGGSLSLQSDLESADRNRAAALSVTGNLLQIAGNTLQAVATIFQLNHSFSTDRAQKIDFAGSWVQALGALLCFLATLDRNDQHAMRPQTAPNDQYTPHLTALLCPNV